MANLSDQNSQIQTLAQWLATSRRAVAFTGAGISTESGIPDYRSPTGVWQKTRPVLYDEFVRSPQARHEFWRFKAAAHADFGQAKPNRAHELLSIWQRQGMLRGVVTQNIDGLHQMAGSQRVLELHGSARTVHCIDCGEHFPVEPLLDAFIRTDEVPECEACGGRLKLAVVMFGEALPEAVFDEAAMWASEADLFLVLGSSLVVYPAAGLPALAKRSGARLAIVNREPTDQDGLADLVIRGSLVEACEAVNRRFSHTAPPHP